jgi:hypothetical protein
MERCNAVAIPSLATMFSITYKPSKTQFRSFHFKEFWLVEFVSMG